MDLKPALGMVKEGNYSHSLILRTGIYIKVAHEIIKTQQL